MSTLKFDLAAEDKAAAASGDVYHLSVFELPGPDGGTESYAAVRPADNSWLALSRSVFVARKDETNMGIAGIKFLDQCLIEEDLREALLEDGSYADDGDGDGELSAFGLELSRSNQRINDRLMDRHDPFGIRTLIDVMESLTEQWSANPTSSPPASSKPRRRTGASSTAGRSSKASTSRKSSTSRRRAS